MLTSYADDEVVFDAVVAGAQGYVLKQVRGGALLDAIRRVAAGASILDPLLIKRLLDRLRMASVDDDRFYGLGKEGRQALDLMADGLGNVEIGERLKLDEDGVRRHVSELLARLGMQRHVGMAGNPTFSASADALVVDRR